MERASAFETSAQVHRAHFQLPGQAGIPEASPSLLWGSNHSDAGSRHSHDSNTTVLAVGLLMLQRFTQLHSGAGGRVQFERSRETRQKSVPTRRVEQARNVHSTGLEGYQRQHGRQPVRPRQRNASSHPPQNSILAPGIPVLHNIPRLSEARSSAAPSTAGFRPIPREAGRPCDTTCCFLSPAAEGQIATHRRPKLTLLDRSLTDKLGLKDQHAPRLLPHDRVKNPSFCAVNVLTSCNPRCNTWR